MTRLRRTLTRYYHRYRLQAFLVTGIFIGFVYFLEGMIG